jgi:signal transduction histidine kinase
VIATDALQGRAGADARRILLGRTGGFAIALAAISVALVSLRTAGASNALSYLSESPTAAAIGLAGGWGLVAVGLETVRRARRPWFGYLLAAAGIAWFLPEWSDPAIGSAVPFTIGLAFAWAYPAIVGHALFASAGGSRPRVLQGFIAGGYAIFALGLGLIPAVGFDPRATGCGFCPQNLVAVVSPGLLVRVMPLATALAVAWSAGATILLTVGLARSGPASRLVRGPIVLPGIGFLALVGISLGRAIFATVPPTDPTDRLLRVGQAISLLAVAAGVAAEWLRARRSRTSLARVVADLAESHPIGGLRDHLATILRDPQLQLAYPLGNGELVDARGRYIDVRPREGRTTTPIVREGSPVAVIEHDAAVLGDPAEVDEVVAAARLGLEHERLQAEARAQLEALRAARRRIVEAGDAHRKQLERDLHDGAQQHLIALSIGLRFIDRGPGSSQYLDDAATELRMAMDDLREVAHGIYPAVLADEGFAAAVDVLAESSRIPMTIAAMVEDRFDPAIEVAAYHVVADAARGSVGPLRISARRSEARLTVEVEGSDIPEPFLDEIEDRVGAVDGSLARARDPGGPVKLVAEIPCGS